MVSVSGFHMVCYLLAVCCLAPSIKASSGDRLRPFQECLVQCSSKSCSPLHPQSMLPLTLRLTRWSCDDDCKYWCMHKITDSHILDITQNRAPDARIHQFYGKWPFLRLCGMQEPASVLFSLMNLWAHWRGGRKYDKFVKNSHPMKKYGRMWSLVSMNAWIWSAVFHTRDTPFTEKLDYFSAALAIVFSLYTVVVRLFHLYIPPRLYLHQQHPSYDRKRLFAVPKHIALSIWSIFCALIFTSHVAYLTFSPKFDYTYNIIFNLVVGSIHNILWLFYSVPRPPFIQRFQGRSSDYMPAYAWKPAALALLTTMATSLELFDFPPWKAVIDAHSLWHLSTVPIIVVWYSFLIQDATDDAWKAGRL